ncbi:MAG TPA: rubredoxin [Nitrospirota bacterium]|nr:rubredoxin [Nitrospirota bacterium]
MVKKGDYTVEVRVVDARDKVRFSGYYPPSLEEWVQRGWEVASRTGMREDFGLWRCAACRWLYKEQKEKTKFKDLPDDWKCPVCKVSKESFEQIG